MLSEKEIVKKQIEYLHSCYFLWLERPTDPLDLSPPKSYGEGIFIGDHIKTVKRLRRVPNRSIELLSFVQLLPILR